MISGMSRSSTRPSLSASAGTESELNFGAGAMAMVMGTEGTIVDIDGIANYSTLFHDKWRIDSESHVSNAVGDRTF